MGLFRRDRHPHRVSPAVAIAEFWAWWPSARPLVEEAIRTGSFEEAARQMSAQVAAIHPRLQWELTAGVEAEHALVVTAGGEHRLRAVAERWMRAGPPPDASWEFHSSRQPDHHALGSTLTVADHELDLSQVVLDARFDEERAVLDIAVHHPLFPRMPEQARMTATFLTLDWLLGEDGVERWIGVVDMVMEPPALSVPATDLPALVAEVAHSHVEPRWAVLSGTTLDGRPMSATARVPMKPVEYPLFDLHVTVTVPYAHADEGGLPVDPSLSALCDLEDALVHRLGGAAVFVGQESMGGSRLLHFYADAEDTVPAQIEALCRSWAEGPPAVHARLDGGWDQVSHLRV
jgi:Family of unknown function (DUF695)